jgi:predicted O-methyltransferase YrrM
MDVSHFIELREGDLRRTLKWIDGPIDFVLVDIWIVMARPALELVAPYLRPERDRGLRQYRNSPQPICGLFCIS